MRNQDSLLIVGVHRDIVVDRIGKSGVRHSPALMVPVLKDVNEPCIYILVKYEFHALTDG